jgi:hypothetical protein
MPEDPVITAPANFIIAINALAKSAPITASIRAVLLSIESESSCRIIAEKFDGGNAGKQGLSARLEFKL